MDEIAVCLLSYLWFSIARSEVQMETGDEFFNFHFSFWRPLTGNSPFTLRNET